MQLAVIDRVEETAAASNRNTPELAPSDLERRAPRQPIQAVVTRNSPQSPHNIGSYRLSWYNEVLNRLNTLSSLEQTPSAAGTSSDSVPGRSHTSSTCSNASTENYSGVPQRNQGSVPEVPGAPEPSEPLEGASHNSSPCTTTSTEQHDQGSVPEARTAPESITLSGEDARERLFQEVLSWSYAPNEHRLREFLHFDSDDPERPFCMPHPAQLDRERRMLERRSARGKVTYTESFRVYGIPELCEHDRLKCWVYLNQFCHGQRWPEGYIPLCTGEELNSHVEYDGMDDMTSIWSGVGSNDSQK